MFLALGAMIAFFGLLRLAAAAFLHDAQLRTRALVWIAAGVLAAAALI
jgi:hypothetical protein